MKTWGFGKVLAKSRRLYLRPAKFNFFLSASSLQGLYILDLVCSTKHREKLREEATAARESFKTVLAIIHEGEKSFIWKVECYVAVSPMSYPETVLNDLINHACLPSKSLKEPIEHGLVTLHICREHRGQNSRLKFNGYKSNKRWQFWSYLAHSARYCSVEREHIIIGKGFYCPYLSCPQMVQQHPQYCLVKYWHLQPLGPRLPCSAPVPVTFIESSKSGCAESF